MLGYGGGRGSHSWGILVGRNAPGWCKLGLGGPSSGKPAISASSDSGLPFPAVQTESALNCRNVAIETTQPGLMALKLAFPKLRIDVDSCFDRVEAFVHLLKTSVHLVEAFVYLAEASIHFVEPTLNHSGELVDGDCFVLW